VQENEVGESCSANGEEQERVYAIGRRARRKETTKKPRRRRVDNIKMDLVEIIWDGLDLIGLARKRGKWRALVNSVMNLRVP
jgi:hypothetical protein